MVPELDHVMAALLDDLNQRGLLESTLVITLAEFGRTPEINPSLGRDHFATAWSATLSGGGIRGGSVYGKTDANGRTVVDGEVGPAELFATIYQALGIDHQKQYMVGSRPVPLTETGTEADPGGPGMMEAHRCPPIPKIKLLKRSLAARTSCSRVARKPGTSQLFCGGSDFTVYEIDVDQAKPEAERARPSCQLRDRPGAGRRDPGLRRIRRPLDLVERRVAVEAPRGRRPSQVDPRRHGRSRRHGRASVADDMVCRVWDAESGRMIHELRGHDELTPTHFPSMLFACAISPDARHLATGRQGRPRRRLGPRIRPETGRARGPGVLHLGPGPAPALDRRHPLTGLLARR